MKFKPEGQTDEEWLAPFDYMELFAPKPVEESAARLSGRKCPAPKTRHGKATTRPPLVLSRPRSPTSTTCSKRQVGTVQRRSHLSYFVGTDMSGYTEVIKSTHWFIPKNELHKPLHVLKSSLNVYDRFGEKDAVPSWLETDSHFGVPLYYRDMGRFADRVVDETESGHPVEIGFTATWRDRQKPIFSQFRAIGCTRENGLSGGGSYRHRKDGHGNRNDRPSEEKRRW